MSSPNPALVSERAAAPLPRVALLLLCAAYVLPGLFGRDPWKNADISAFGYIVGIAQGKVPWLAPSVGGLPADGALLPYWLGAVFVKATSPWLDPAFAARVPFALLLAAAIALTWYAAYHLARSESAQPLPFAFGGEATPVDYARAIADGAVLALLACLGLLQLGHETTPELAQLAAVALYLYGLAVASHKAGVAGWAAALALLALAVSGAPAVAVLLALAGLLVTLRSRTEGRRRLAAFIVAGALVGALAAWALGAWANRLGDFRSVGQVLGLGRTFVWFTWPAWMLAGYTLWRWRRHLSSRHIGLPLACAATLLAVWIAMAGSDRALMLVLPALAVLAAFALPTLQRGAAAAIDWFSVFFFSIAAATGWVFYAAIQTGTPAKLAANVAKLSPGYAKAFSPLALLVALLATLAWLWLVRWRTGRNRHPLWKSLVLPAAGVTLFWLINMTVLLEPWDNARSYRSMVQRIARQVPADACISAPGVARSQIVALEYFGNWRVDAATPLADARCGYLLLERNHAPPGPAWEFLAREIRIRREDDGADVYRRVGAGRG